MNSDKTINALFKVSTFDVVYKNGLSIPFGGSYGEKIYAVWAETIGGQFIQNIFICDNSIKLSSRKMPSYWFANIKDKAVDAVTSATHKVNGSKNIDFTIPDISLKDSNIRSFYVCFEIDRSWDSNDWFPASSYDQPAILYKALVDLDSATTEFTLTPVGWTAGPMNDITSLKYIPGFSLGKLNSEMRYITNLRNQNNSSIGPVNPDTTKIALSMVGSIKVKVNK
jgi:hypothetical protein